MDNFEAKLNAYVEPLEQALSDFLPTQNKTQKAVIDAMRYSLLSGGKRLRGVLVMATYTLFDSDFTRSIPFAAAVEMIHAYSLIHDDLPCMDDDDMRRGKPSCHKQFGEAVALLAGDGLLTKAFEVMSDAENIEAFGAEKIVRAIASLATAAGSDGMVAGQMIDLENENTAISEEILNEINAKKTGALIKSSCEIGCILGGASAENTKLLLDFAAKLGLAFQIQDDVLDIIGDANELGKPIGSDQENQKTTYASLYGIEKAQQKVEELTESALASLKQTGLDTVFLQALANGLVNRKK